MKIAVHQIQVSDCRKGDVLVATDRDLRAGRHPIVFLEDHNCYDFLGCMLTHEVTPDNAPMLESHFLDTSDEFEFDNTQIVIGKFVKFGDWGPFYKVGRLSESGIAFVEDVTADSPIETFAHYFRRKREKVHN